MKQQIKESYDQIHAPLSLINQTKQLVHTTIETKEEVRKIPNKRWIPITASLAACLALVVTGVAVITNSTKATTPLKNNSVIAGDNDTSPGKVFHSIASQDTWEKDLAIMKAVGASNMALEKDYILYELPFTQNGCTYQLQFEIHKGTLVLRDSTYFLEGSYQCVVLDGTNVLGTTTLPFTISREFAGDTISVVQADQNQDGKEEFLLEGTWYQIRTDYQVSAVK